LSPDTGKAGQSLGAAPADADDATAYEGAMNMKESKAMKVYARTALMSAEQLRKFEAYCDMLMQEKTAK
jgi:hypothetical protein